MGTGLLTLSPSAATALVALALEGSPTELCAVGIGPADRVHELRLVRNAHPAPTTGFAMHAGDLLRAYRAADERGWRVTAYVHTHPSGSPTPSAADLRAAGAVRCSVPHVIVSSDSDPATRAFILDAHGATELAIAVDGQDEGDAAFPPMIGAAHGLQPATSGS